MSENKNNAKVDLFACSRLFLLLLYNTCDSSNIQMLVGTKINVEKSKKRKKKKFILFGRTNLIDFLKSTRFNVPSVVTN